MEPGTLVKLFGPNFFCLCTFGRTFQSLHSCLGAAAAGWLAQVQGRWAGGAALQLPQAPPCPAASCVHCRRGPAGVWHPGAGRPRKRAAHFRSAAAAWAGRWDEERCRACSWPRRPSSRCSGCTPRRAAQVAPLPGDNLISECLVVRWRTFQPPPLWAQPSAGVTVLKTCLLLLVAVVSFTQANAAQMTPFLHPELGALCGCWGANVGRFWACRLGASMQVQQHGRRLPRSVHGGAGGAMAGKRCRPVHRMPEPGPHVAPVASRRTCRLTHPASHPRPTMPRL